MNTTVDRPGHDLGDGDDAGCELLDDLEEAQGSLEELQGLTESSDDEQRPA